MQTTDIDEGSVLAVLDWALYHRLYPVVEELLNFVRLPEDNPLMDGRVKFYLSRMMATNLTWTDPANILALLNHLKTLDGDQLPESIGSDDMFYWKREVLFQGALSLLLRQLYPDGSMAHWKKSEDVHIPEEFSFVAYYEAMQEFFNTNHEIYQIPNTSPAEAEETFNSDFNDFTKDLMKIVGPKRILQKSKVYMLAKKYTWETRLASFLEFLDKLEKAIFPVNPIVTVTYPDGGHFIPGDLMPSADIAEPYWTDADKETKGPYARELAPAPAATSTTSNNNNHHPKEDNDHLPENSFSSPQKYQLPGLVQPPNILAMKNEIKNITNKYDQSDPLQEALGQSATTKLFASKPTTNVNDIPKRLSPETAVSKLLVSEIVSNQPQQQSTAGGKGKNKRPLEQTHSTTVQGTSSRIEFDDLGTDRQTEKIPRSLIDNHPQVTSSPAKKPRLISEENGNDEESTEPETKEEDEDNIASSLYFLKEATKDAQNKKIRKSLANVTLGTSVTPIEEEVGDLRREHRKRNKWTVDEDITLEAGVKKYGEGAWALIKQDPKFANQLKNRTNVNLKDRYRNLAKKGHIERMDMG